MNTKTAIKSTPKEATLEVKITIDQDEWRRLKSQGFSDSDLQKAIELAITFKNTVYGAIAHSPIFDIEDVVLLKYTQE